MKVIKCDLPTELKSIELHPLFDLHIGDSLSDGLLIQETIDHIKNTPNAYCILGGDLMDTAIATSVGDTYGANLQPMQQLEMCVKLFEPIKDKILCIVPGNHENRIYRSDGMDITAIMAAQLGLQGKYSATSSFLFVRLGKDQSERHHGRKVSYSIYCYHGSGGGKKKAGKSTVLQTWPKSVMLTFTSVGILTCQQSSEPVFTERRIKIAVLATPISCTLTRQPA